MYNISLSRNGSLWAQYISNYFISCLINAKKCNLVCFIAVFNNVLLWFLHVIWISYQFLISCQFFCQLEVSLWSLRSWFWSCDWPLCVCVCFPWPLGLWFNLWPGCEWDATAGQWSVSEGVQADGWTEWGMTDARLLYWGSTTNSRTSTSSSGHLLLIWRTHAKHTAPLFNTHTHFSWHVADVIHLLLHTCRHELHLLCPIHT